MDIHLLCFMKLPSSFLQFKQSLNAKIHHLQTFTVHHLSNESDEDDGRISDLGLVTTPGMPLLILFYPRK